MDPLRKEDLPGAGEYDPVDGGPSVEEPAATEDATEDLRRHSAPTLHRNKTLKDEVQRAAQLLGKVASVQVTHSPPGPTLRQRLARVQAAGTHVLFQQPESHQKLFADAAYNEEKCVGREHACMHACMAWHWQARRAWAWTEALLYAAHDDSIVPSMMGHLSEMVCLGSMAELHCGCGC